jgi:hypothetical protein
MTGWTNPRYRREQTVSPIQSATGGGASPYRLGYAFEISCKGILERRDWLVIRSPASKSKVDLFAIHALYRPMLVQAKRTGMIGSAEWNELWEIAERHNCLAVITYRETPKTIAWMRLDGPREPRRPGRPWTRIDPRDCQPVAVQTELLAA